MNGRDDLVSAHAETPYSAVPVFSYSPVALSLYMGIIPAALIHSDSLRNESVIC